MDSTQTTLRETLTEAFDAAEPVEPSTPVVESTATESEAPAKPERPRDEGGKFVKSEAKPEAKSEAKPEAPARPKKPTTWKKEYDPDWERLDPRIAAYIEQRENEYSKGVSTYKQEWDRAKPVLDALAPFQSQFQKFGVRPEQWIQNLGAAHQALALGTPEQKLQHFVRLAREYNVPLQALFAPQPGGAPQPAIDPRIAMLVQQATAPLRKQMNEWQTEQQKQQEARIASEIDAFKADPANEHFEEMKETIAQLLERGATDTLRGAYDLALRMPQHESLWVATQEAKRKAEEARRIEESRRTAQQAKAKAVSLRSSSPGASGGKTTDGKKTIREQLSEQFESLGARV